MNDYLKIIISVITIVFLFNSIYSQQENYNIDHITVEEGLPTNFCMQVLKDKHGFVWIATNNGLCRYDGYDIKVYQNDPIDSSSLSCNDMSWMESLAIDSNGNLWIGTTKGLNKYDAVKDNFRRYLHDPNNPASLGSNWIYCIYVDNTGNIWIGHGKRGGLSRYLPDKEQFVQYNNFANDDSTYIPSIYALYEDQQGIFWVGTADGLYQFDRKKQLFTRIEYIPEHPDPANPIHFKYMYEAIDGTLFIGTQFGYLTFNRQSDELMPFEPLYNENEYYGGLGIFQGHNQSTMWLIADKIFEYDLKTGHLKKIPDQPGTPENIFGEVIRSLYADESGLIWMPSERGVSVIIPDLLKIESHPEISGMIREANKILQDSHGHLWIGGSSLLRIDKENKLVKEYAFPGKDLDLSLGTTIISMHEDVEGNIWVGTYLKGLYVIENGSDELVRCDISERDPYIISALYEDMMGDLWIGTELGLYRHLNGSDPVADFYQDQDLGILNDIVIVCIYQDSNGNYRIGTEFDGLYFLPAESSEKPEIINFSHNPNNNNSLSNNFVCFVNEDASGHVWIATQNGLNRFDPQENDFIRFYREDDLAANMVYSIIADQQGFLWLGTESGLMRYKVSKSSDQDSIVLDYKEVMPGKDIVTNWLSEGDDGKIYIGASSLSGQGYYSFHPDSVNENTRIPSIIVSEFLVNHKKIDLDTNLYLMRHLILSHKQNFFSFRFSALDYMQPEKNQYAYYLEGLEDDWIYSGTNRTANYTGVPSGNYIFHVKGSNNDGYWNQEGISIAVTILPPPWKTWWAYTLYGLAAIALIYFWRRYDLKRQRLKKDFEIEQIEYEKLKELDNVKSHFFANISHELRTPLTLMLGPLEKIKAIVSAEVRQDVEMMLRNGMRLRNMINQLLNLSKLESGNVKLNIKEEEIVSVINSYVQMFESLARQKKIDLVFSSTEDNIPIYVDREKIEKILYNLLSNAFKYTPDEGKISVKIEKAEFREDEDHKLNIIVTDSGQGIPEEHIPHIFNRFYQASNSYSQDQQGTGIGLAIVKELVELHHGEINVMSVPDKYTSFQLIIPFGLENRYELKNDSGVMLIQEESSNEVDLLSGSSSSSEGVYKGTIQDHRAAVLIIDDNEDLRLYLNESLEETYQVIEALDGMDGLEKAVEFIPDLIVTDVMMPVMDGIELCKRIKSDIRTSHIPVILLTARAGSESRIEGLETGADDFITKPFDNHELLIRIKNLIDQRKKLRERFLINAKEFGIDRLMDIPDSGINLSDKEFLRKAIGVIEEHLDDNDFGVEQFVKEMAVSNMQLYRKLKALVDLSANDFIRSIRLIHAAKMIRQKKDNITQIAYAVGFNNPSYFADCFKKQYGVSPSKYQQSK